VNSLENSVVRRLLSPKKHVVTTDFRLSKAEKKPLEQPEIAEKRLPNGLKWGGIRLLILSFVPFLKII
jgi:hypothetical protein